MKINEKNLKLMPPWYTYHREVSALFGRDSEIQIKELTPIDNNYEFIILVSNKEKAEALKILLGSPLEIGSVTVNVYIYGPDENSPINASDNIDTYSLIENAFKDNPIFSRIEDRSFAGFEFTYCIFKKEVIQFWNDNIDDINGNCSTLAENIARKILKIEDPINFCTDTI